MPQTPKICERCQQGKPATHEFFASDFRMQDQLSLDCLACRYAIRIERRKRKSEKSREWANANREKVREINRRTYDKNRQQRLEYMRRWRMENSERINEYQRAYAERKRQEQSSNQAHS